MEPANSSERKSPRVPAGERIYLIGEIPRDIDPLADLLASIRADAKSREPAKTTLVLIININIDNEGGAREELLRGLAAEGRPGLIILRGTQAVEPAKPRQGGETGTRLSGPYSRTVDLPAIDGAPAQRIDATWQRNDGSASNWFESLPRHWTVGDYSFTPAAVSPSSAREAKRADGEFRAMCLEGDNRRVIRPQHSTRGEMRARHVDVSRLLDAILTHEASDRNSCARPIATSSGWSGRSGGRRTWPPLLMQSKAGAACLAGTAVIAAAVMLIWTLPGSLPPTPLVSPLTEQYTEEHKGNPTLSQYAPDSGAEIASRAQAPLRAPVSAQETRKVEFVRPSETVERVIPARTEHRIATRASSIVAGPEPGAPPLDPYAGRIAKPLTGEALQSAIVADRLATKELNMRQLQKVQAAAAEASEN